MVLEAAPPPREVASIAAGTASLWPPILEIQTLAAGVPTIPGYKVVLDTKPGGTVSTSIQSLASQRRARFSTLADEWHRETDYLSSPTQVATHQNYLEIIAFGELAIPLILNDLRRRGGEWYRALRAIARSINTDPPVLSDTDLSDSRRVEQVWLGWGRQHGFIQN